MTKLHKHLLALLIDPTLQIKLVFLYQLPPRKFWNFVLDDGFNLIDFIVVRPQSAIPWQSCVNVEC